MQERFFYILFLVVCALPGRSQTQLFTLEDGLSNKSVTSVLQTRNGYLWVGTANGLNRYNGYTFYEYNRQNGLSSGRINCLYEDTNGKLWIGTWQGLNILDQRTGEVKKLLQKENKVKGSVLNSIVRRIVRGIDGSVLVALENGVIMRFTDENNYEIVFELTKTGGNEKLQMLDLKISADGSIYFLTNYGSVKKINRAFREEKNFTTRMRDVIAFAIHPDGKKIILLNIVGHTDHVSSETGLPGGNGPGVMTIFPGDLVTAAYIFNEKHMWTGHSEGSLVYTDLVTGTSYDHTTDARNLITGAATVIYPDRSGVLWVGSNYGLVKFCPKAQNFENYLFRHGAAYKDKNSMRGLVEAANGDIYAGGYNGLFRLRPGDTAIKHFEFGELGLAHRSAFYPYRLIDDGNYIWISSEVMGIYRFNKTTERLEFPVSEPDFVKSCSLLAEGRDTLLVGTHRGLYIYDKKRNLISKYANPKSYFNLSEVEVTEMVKDPAGNTWIGSYASGLFRMNKNKVITRHFSEAITNIPLNFISALYSGDDSVLWIGTRESGLVKMNTRTHKTTVYTKKQGLADNSVAGIVKDNSGFLWISTFNGLSKFNPASGLCENYYDKDGLTDNEFNISSHLKTRTGKIFLGGLDGINAFNPATLKRQQKKQPLIFLTGFVKYDGNTDKLEERSGDLSKLKEISFTHRDKFFSFSFALDDYYEPTRNTFFYKLDGYDNTWVNIGTQNNLRFNSLPAGNYNLRIRGVNSEGAGSANELMFNISVSRPFYNTIWFYALMLCAAVLLVYLITRYRVHQALKIARLRTKISSDLHDEVGGLLTRISVQAELIRQGISLGDTLKEVGKIADTSRLATAAMSDVLWSIDARNDKAGDLIDRLREQAGEILFPLEVGVVFTVNNIDPEKEIDNTTRQNIFLIFKEAVNNIARHAGASEVKVVLENKGEQFVMMIEDNGQKRQPGAKQGQGLRNMKMRAERMNGTLEVENKNGFKVTLKIHKL